MVTSYACYRVLEESCRAQGLELIVFLAAGHSLGEYTALLITGAMTFEAAVDLVQTRARCMTDVGKGYPGAGLMAVLGRKKELDYDQLCAKCKEYNVYITVNNTKKQIVVGGSKQRLGELAKELKSEGMASTLLKVEGPFHTPIMRPGAEKFKRALNKTTFDILSRPIVANVTTDAIVDPRHIRDEGYHQIFQPVNWLGAMEKIVAGGADLFIEVGPKKVLTNMLREIAPSIPALNVEDPASLEKTMEALKIDD